MAENIGEQIEKLQRAYLGNLALKIREGKSLTDREFQQLEKLRIQFGGSADTTQGGAPSVTGESDGTGLGVPETLRFKRHYTMSEKALEQRRKAAHGSKVNNWKHGKSAKSFLSRLKPCHKTCHFYPCEVVANGGTRAGGICLEKAAVINNYQTLIKAVEKKEYADFNELASITIAESIHTLHLLLEDIMRDGTIIKKQKYDKDGNLIGYDVVTHPSLLALPKMIADLGITPDAMMITPKAIAKQADDDEGIKSIADLMSNIGKGIMRKRLDASEDEE